MLTNKIGVHLGTPAQAAELAVAANEAGARVAGVDLALGPASLVDEPYLESLRSHLEAVRSAGLSILARVGPELTVAPSGLGAFALPGDAPVARAWVTEFLTNLESVAAGAGELVTWWEVLPEPNRGPTPRIHPHRFARLTADAKNAIESAGAAGSVIPGGLLSTDDSDGTSYLRHVLEGWVDLVGGVPFDTLPLHLRIYPDGAPSEDALADTVRDRVATAARLTSELASKAPDIAVTWMGWDAGLAGEGDQARDLWTAYNALIGEAQVPLVLWAGLVDSEEGQWGLHRGRQPAAENRRPSWQAYQDFAAYAAQISPSPWASRAAEADEGVIPGWDTPAEIPAPPTEAGVAPTAITGEAEALAPQGAQPEGLHEGDAVPADESIAPATAPSEATVAPGGTRTVSFRIPTPQELLRQQGLEGSELEAALSAVERKFGQQEMLPPGQYAVEVAGAGAPKAETSQPTYTNQDVITAFYRAGEGSWALFERSGLVLSELASRRNEPYAGPRIQVLSTLDEDERARVASELKQLQSDRR